MYLTNKNYSRHLLLSILSLEFEIYFTFVCFMLLSLSKLDDEVRISKEKNLVEKFNIFFVSVQKTNNKQHK